MKRECASEETRCITELRPRGIITNNRNPHSHVIGQTQILTTIWTCFNWMRVFVHIIITTKVFGITMIIKYFVPKFPNFIMFSELFGSEGGGGGIVNIDT